MLVTGKRVQSVEGGHSLQLGAARPERLQPAPAPRMERLLCLPRGSDRRC
jgi:hypothetical protein